MSGFAVHYDNVNFKLCNKKLGKEVMLISDKKVRNKMGIYGNEKRFLHQSFFH